MYDRRQEEVDRFSFRKDPLGKMKIFMSDVTRIYERINHHPLLITQEYLFHLVLTLIILCLFDKIENFFY